MKKISLLSLLAATLSLGAFATPAHAIDYTTTYETLAVPESEVKLNGGAFLIFGFEYLEKSNDDIICAKSKTLGGLPSVYGCYTPTISGDDAMNRYNNLPLEVSLEYTRNGERLLGFAIDQKQDGLGFCRKATAAVPGADAAVYRCYEPAH